MSTKLLWICVVVAPLSLLVVSTMCLWPGPRWKLLTEIAFMAIFAEPFLALALLAAIPVAIYFLISGAVKWRDREQSTRRLSRAIPYFCIGVLTWIVLWAGLRIRHAAFERASETGNEVVRAIDRYQRIEGAYPDNLERLVPKYLAQIPGTGLLGYPDFYYCKRGDPAVRTDGNAEYELGIRCGSGGINFDVFFYWPGQAYPDFVYGGGVERIGKWAYVHE